MRTESKTLKLVLTALFVAIAYVLPFATGQIEQFGDMLAPMHAPILICGFICGWKWGLSAGLVAPILRSLTLAKPPMFPTAICMAFELAVYGAVAGLMYKVLPKKTWSIYVSLLTAMISGRIVWGIARFAMAGFDINSFGLSAFWAGAVANAFPGIIVQFVLIPVIIILLNRKKTIWR